MKMINGSTAIKSRSFVLPVIVFSQFCCTSVWFASNGVMPELIEEFRLLPSALEHLTSAVQFGFIGGTFVFAALTIADRFSPGKVFLFCALLAALFNFGTVLESNNFLSLMTFRLLTGFCLAGIYPVGMKIAADYFKQGLGRSLGFLVGALVIGTAFPHLTRDLSGTYSWRLVPWATSLLAVLGGILMYLLVPDGPYRRPGKTMDLTAFFKVFGTADFRAAAFGYFGHMWELYAFWAFVPHILSTYSIFHQEASFNIPLISFVVIGLGGPACFLGGYLSSKVGARKVAISALSVSGLCCLASPLVLFQDNAMFLLLLLMIWGVTVVTDSPMFSTLVASNAPPENKGTALTIVNCIGFSITIISLQLLGWIWEFIDHRLVYLLLAIGPALGLLGFLQKK